MPDRQQDILDRLDRFEAENAARRVMARYMELCDQPDNGYPIAQLGDLFVLEAVWEGRGASYSAAFGRHVGRQAIMDFIGSFRRPPHFALNVHFLTSESISVGETGPLGRWVMLQLSRYADGQSSMLGARLEVRFAREDGAWRIAHFQTENLFSAPWEHASDGVTAFLTPAR
jgi:hypothetical protein